MQQPAPPAIVVEGLKAALKAHAEGRYLEIGDGWDDAVAAEHDDERVSLALNLWESWADSAGHGWRFYEGLSADDWPRLATHVVEALQRGTPVTDPVVLLHFGAAARSQKARGGLAGLVVIASVAAVLLASVMAAFTGASGLSVRAVALAVAAGAVVATAAWVTRSMLKWLICRKRSAEPRERP